jgi:hypothetical protein
VCFKVRHLSFRDIRLTTFQLPLSRLVWIKSVSNPQKELSLVRAQEPLSLTCFLLSRNKLQGSSRLFGFRLCSSSSTSATPDLETKSKVLDSLL